MTKKQRITEIMRQDISESVSFMRQDKPVILNSIWILCAFNLCFSAMLMVSMPVLITQTLNMSNQLYGYSQGALAAGGLFGGILVGIFSKSLTIKKIHLLLFSTAMLLLPIAISLWIGLPALLSYLIISVSCFLMMSLATMVTVQILTFIQGETPMHLIGKVLSLTMALAMCAQPLGQAIYGFLFDAFQTTPHFIVFGAAVTSGGIALLSQKVFGHIDDK